MYAKIKVEIEFVRQVDSKTHAEQELVDIILQPEEFFENMATGYNPYLKIKGEVIHISNSIAGQEGEV